MGHGRGEVRRSPGCQGDHPRMQAGEQGQPELGDVLASVGSLQLRAPQEQEQKRVRDRAGCRAAEEVPRRGQVSPHQPSREGVVLTSVSSSPHPPFSAEELGPGWPR